MDKCPKCHAPARCGPPDGDFKYTPPYDYKPELTAANKAIVALSEALSEYLDSHYPDPAQYALTTHADAIKRARGEE